MKVCVIQPEYSFDINDSEKLFSKLLLSLDRCDESMDVIVLPEYCDTPTVVKDVNEFDMSVSKFNGRILEKARQTAKRCKSTVFVNAAYKEKGAYRNTTHVIDKNGNTIGRYYKAHPAPSEFLSRDEGGRGMDCEYCYEFSKPYTIDIDGVRYGFMTCYDFYFYEAYAALARQKVDIIIGCSHQRSDLHHAIELNCAFLCYQTNAYLLRASVSLGKSAKVGGCSLIATPDGKILASLKNDVGMLVRDIDPHKKYYKPQGFGRPAGAHFEYIEKGRHPQNYRPCGSAIVKNDDRAPYPRVCAHRGFSTAAPENTLAAYGAAVALGADEIEFDVWFTKDKKLVLAHDQKLERVSNGSGFITDYTYSELLQFDFGAKWGKAYEGLKIALFEDVLKKFSCHTIMNIHIKTIDNKKEYDNELLNNMLELIYKYDCEQYVYFMSGNDTLLAQLKKAAPHIKRCCGRGDKPWEIVERAIALGCQKVQFFKPYFNQQMIDKAHEHGIKCNLFWSDDVKEALGFLEMGIDTILTNDYLKIANAVKNNKTKLQKRG